MPQMGGETACCTCSDIKHHLLNARPENVRKEAKVIGQAGLPGSRLSKRESAVTIATNMAGRGTDILLGGDPRDLAQSCIESLAIPILTAGGVLLGSTRCQPFVTTSTDLMVNMQGLTWPRGVPIGCL